MLQRPAHVEASGAEQPLSVATRLLLASAGGLAVIAGPALLFFPSDTGFYFAWTIGNPLTPVFMGASYLSGAAVFLALRANRWSVARVQVPAIIVFAATQLVATLLDLDVLDWNHPTAWAWIAVYIVSPLAAIPIFVVNERRWARPPAQGRRLPRFTSPSMLLLTLLSGGFGLALFIVPMEVAPIWPWSLTPLTGRLIGGWLLSGAALYWMIARQRTLERASVGLCATAIVMSFLLLGGALNRDAFGGPAASTALYVAYLAGALVTVIAICARGIAGDAPASLLVNRRTKRRPTGGATTP